MHSGYTSCVNCTDDGSGVNIVSDPVTVSNEGKDQSVKGICADNAGNKSEINLNGINIDKTPPIVTIKATPDTIWPPNGKMVAVLITGESFDKHIEKTSFQVIDEYSLIQPALTDFNQIIQLEAKRNGNDIDGRQYTIKARAEDKAGNTSEATTTVVVRHDQRK